jgi:UDP-N-acetylmuramoyl-tripeptide--D-alanyl-D-alanine ligase
MAGVAGVSIDSRTIRKGELFFAIRGPNHDGHSFLSNALAKGALAGVVGGARFAEYPEEIKARLLPVEDPLRALQQLARKYCESWRRAKQGRRLAAVTGSAGKTTTKEILAALLGARFRVLKSEGNLNNEYGLPLTLFRLGDEHDVAVVELGMSRRGELARLAEIARPDVGLVTNVAPVHLEFFSSVDEIALAKRELIEGLGSQDPVAVLNQDDVRVARFAEVFRGRVHFFGISHGAEFRAENLESRGIEGSAFDFQSPKWSSRLELALTGLHNVMNALAALAAASEWEIGEAESKRILASLRPASLRGEIVRFAENFTVISDCYNSNPMALERMVDLLCVTPGYKRRILLAGAWREIGPSSAEMHRAGGKYAAAKNRIDWIIGVDGDAREYVRGAIEAGHPKDRTAFFENSDEAGAFAATLVSPGDLLLLKGSRGVRMENILDAIEAKHARLPANGAPANSAAERKAGG